MNISNPKGTPEDIKGNKQVKNYFYNIAAYWTKVTNDSLMEHIAKNVAEDRNAAFKNISENYDIKYAELDNKRMHLEVCLRKKFPKKQRKLL